MQELSIVEKLERNAGRFWLVLQEPGRIPERKGPWLKSGMATVIREFIKARPTAYIHVLTVDEDGEPSVDHGPETLQILDGRSMSTGRAHNARVRAAHAECHAALSRAQVQP
jgi:hypothetical protein